MDLNELYMLLDMDSGDDFRYFENVAELFESSRDIGNDVIYALLLNIDLHELKGLCSQYFDQLGEVLPESETDFFTLLDIIGRVFKGMIEAAIKSRDSGEEDRNMILKLADEIGKFRAWYSLTDHVGFVDEISGESGLLPVRDALTLIREENLGEGSYRIDFSEAACRYPLDEYIMSFSDLTGLSGGE